MVYPAQPSDPSYLHQIQESPSQKQKRFEMEFQTAVLGIYNSAASKNSAVEKQLSQIKEGIGSGKSPDQLAHSLNLVITQLNQGLRLDETLFPPFQFIQNSEVEAMTNHLLCLKKCINALGKAGKIKETVSSQLMHNLDQLTKEVARSTRTDTVRQLNDIIQQVNRESPQAIQLPNLNL